METTIKLDKNIEHLELFGTADGHLKTIRDVCNVNIAARGEGITVSGAKVDVERAAGIISKMQQRIAEGRQLNAEDIKTIAAEPTEEFDRAASSVIAVYSPKGTIRPFTAGQHTYVDVMRSNDLAFCTGPAGTGKTYLAVAVAVSMLKKKMIRKIILARPAVEAGERLGFLPGDIQAKVNPYLHPLFDSLEDMMEFTQMRKLIDMDIIEVIPLAFMRGRTLNNAVIICDEAQNTSPSQMLMVLTRMGRGSKMIITGDITQMDLEKGQKSGMLDAMETLRNIEGIGFVALDDSDIVRHNLVQNIVQAYDTKKKR